MKIINQTIRYATGILFLLGTVLSCATVSDLKVLYRLPPESDALKGKKVFLKFEDKRANKDILGKEAQKQFKKFSGNITYSLARDQKGVFRIGVYDVPSLFMDVFKRRFENLGVQVAQHREEGQIEMVIALEDFLLDLVNREWVVTIGYEASLVKDGRVLSTQVISGQGQRFKWVGRGQADIVTGEIFTDMVNKLNMSRLFQQANL